MAFETGAAAGATTGGWKSAVALTTSAETIMMPIGIGLSVVGMIWIANVARNALADYMDDEPSDPAGGSSPDGVGAGGAPA